MDLSLHLPLSDTGFTMLLKNSIRKVLLCVRVASIVVEETS